jgi:hypothetical protein
MIDEIQPVGPSGLLNLIEAMKRGIPVGPAATGSDDNPSKQALADIQYPATQGATPNPQGVPFGSLAMPQQLQPDLTALNSVPGFSMRAPDAPFDPYAGFDKKKREELEKKAAAGVFATGADAVPQAGVSSLQTFTPGPFGSLAPMAPQQPGAPAASIPLPRPRPAIPAQALPPAVASAQASAPQQPSPEQPAAAPAAPQEPSFFSKVGNALGNNSNMLIGMGAGLAGAPSIGAGISRGLTGASAGAQLDLKQNELNTSNTALLRAFQDAKVPTALSIAALKDPVLRQKIFDNYFADRKGELKTIDLPNGTKMSVYHHPFETDPAKTVTDLQGKPLDLGNLPGAIDPKLTGNDAYQAALTTNPKLAAKALALKEGREIWPVGRAVTAGDNQQAMDLARQMDPLLTEANATLRHQTITDYGPKGKTGYARTAASTLLGHADQYDKLIDQQGNNDIGGSVGNQFRDYIKTTMGTDKQYLNTKGAMGELRTGIANELEKALAGRVSVQGIKDILAPLDQAKGPTEQHAAIQGIIHMLGTRLDEMSNNFDTSMNTQTQGFHMLSPKAREIFKHYGGQVSGEDAPSAMPGIADPGAIHPLAAASVPAGPLPPGKYSWSKTTGVVPQ